MEGIWKWVGEPSHNSLKTFPENFKFGIASELCKKCMNFWGKTSDSLRSFWIFHRMYECHKVK